MTKELPKKAKRTLQSTLTKVATASTMLCTTLLVLSPIFEGGTGPKLPPASGE